MKRQGKTLHGMKVFVMGLAVAFIASTGQAGQLSKVLCVDMCGSTGSGGACHPGQQRSGSTMMDNLATTYGFTVTHTADGAQFNSLTTLSPFDVIVLNNDGNNPFSPTQQANFIKYLYAGGGFVGWHASAASHYQWPWYTDSFMCADINGHGGVDPWPILLDSINKAHPVLKGTFCNIVPRRDLKDTIMADEWYYWKPDIAVTVKTDTTIKILVWVNQNNVKRPMSWCHSFWKGGSQPGRLVYSNCGQANTTGGNNYYTNGWFMQFVINSLRWAAHVPPPEQCTAVSPSPGSNQYNRETLDGMLSKGNLTVHVYGVNGREIAAGTFKNYRELLGAMPVGCHIVKVSDNTQRIVRQLTVAK
jgi:type 1 glutamine amidotransferase